MDRTLSWLAGAELHADPEVALAEVDAAIAMVARGFASRVRLCNLPAAEAAAFDAAARAQAAGLQFALDRDASGAVTLIVGPRASLVDTESIPPLATGDAIDPR